MVMEVVLLLIAISLPLFLLFKRISNRVRKSNHRPPGPRGLPLIGNLHQFDSLNTHLYLLKLSQKYGPLVSLKLGSVKILVVSSPCAAKEIFKYHDLCFSSRPALVGGHKLSYNSLDIALAPYNERWRDMKKLSTLHLFNSKSSRSFRPIREHEVSRMIKTICDGASDSNIVNLSKTVVTFTSSVIFKITFGKRYDDAAGNTNNNTTSRFNWILAETQQLIDEHLHASSTVSTQNCSSILDILLQMKMDSSEFTFDHIKALFMNIIVGASDTSAVAAVWAMTLLVKNPTSMKKVQQEVRELKGEKGFVDENDVQELVYLKAVVKEALRLHPPAPLLLPRETIEKCVISGYEIEAKTRVYVNAYAIGRDPESWENPDEFLPERFMNSSIDFKGQDFELIPFGVGRRICAGMSMGVATTELVLANLLYSFNWELPPGKQMADIDMATLPGIILHKKNDLCLVPKINN